MVKLGKHLTKRIAKKPVAKKPKLTCTLDDITFNNCEKLKRYKKLKEHPYFQEVIDENTVRFHSSTLNFFWKSHEILKERRVIELSHTSVACAGLTEEKYHNYILLSPSQYGDGRCTDIVAYELFLENFQSKRIIRGMS
ncbi:unnamed protein product [Rhizophagus irregularis]|uniref:Uncharacterized protein n=1 Tax=Rhizophagus irregularis TaxID=588596 RepID=A0A915ZEE9_9GLOM|nr:unnamed protein product [Rhizophagus irregularis]CAB5371444.1 unnamed protein product [Rhizophagus irregularis]